MRVPIANPIIGEAEKKAVAEVMESGNLTMGSKVHEFEAKWAEYVGVRHGIMVNSGSSANLLMMTTYRNFEGKGEVITPAVTWATTVFPIAQVGMKPVLVDVDNDFNISLDAVRKAITPKTKAILPVHLLGNPARMKELKEIAFEENDLDILEDCCEAHGAEEYGQKVGSSGKMATFSFFMSHHITCGEGGMIMTDDDDIAEHLRSLRVFGWTRDMKLGDLLAANRKLDPRWCFWNPGYNLRPTEMNAAIGLSQLPRLEEYITKRRANAEWYDNNLSLRNGWRTRRKDSRHVYLLYGLLSPKRQKLTAFLEKNGIETRPVISGNMARQPAMEKINYRISGKLRNAEEIHNEGFCIGVHPGIGQPEREYLKLKFEEFFSG